MKFQLQHLSIIFICLIACSSEQKKESLNKKTVSADNLKPSQPKPKVFSSITGVTEFNQLKNKSSSFIRYSRNQFFAKKGYDFSDPDLELFFSEQTWYNKRNSNDSIFLSKTEQFIVDSLKSYEQQYGIAEYQKILHRFKFNGHPLFYITWNPQLINNRPNHFFKGGFVLLDTSKLWTLQCKTIPPEYLKENSIGFIELIDDSGLISENQIEMKNIDQGMIGDKGEELIIHLEGASDDYHDVLLGFNKEGKFDILFNEFTTLGSVNILNDSTIKFSTDERCDFIGTMFCRRHYLYNTKTKVTTEIPYTFDKVNLTTTTRDSIKIFKNSLAATKQDQDYIIKTLAPDTRIKIVYYLNNSCCYEIKSNDMTGWINKGQLYKTNVIFAD